MYKIIMDKKNKRFSAEFSRIFHGFYVCLLSFFNKNLIYDTL